MAALGVALLVSGCGGRAAPAPPVTTPAVTTTAALPSPRASAFRTAPPIAVAHQGGEAEAPSDTLYAFRHALAAGAGGLELDAGVTADGVPVVAHDTTVDRTTEGTGTISSMTLAQIEALDAAHWWCGDGRTARGCAAYPLRGSGDPTLRIPTLQQVLDAFPSTPMSVEVKAASPAEDEAGYVANAKVIAAVVAGAHRTDVAVVSSSQAAVDAVHAAAPEVPLAPGTAGATRFVLGGDPGPGVALLELPVRRSGIVVTSPANVTRSHAAGFGWWVFLDGAQGGAGDDEATWRSVLDACVDGVTTGRPTAFLAVRASWLATGGAARCSVP